MRGFRSAIVLVALLVLPCCALHPRPIQADPGINPEVLAVWNKHLGGVTRVADSVERSESFSFSDDFGDDVAFFESLTAIRCRCNGTLIGRMPCAELSSDIESWRAWFRQHGKELSPSEVAVHSQVKEGRQGEK